MLEDLKKETEQQTQVYGFAHNIQSFAIANPFVSELNKACYQLGKKLQPFTFFSNDIQKNAGVLDLTQIQGMINGDISLLDEITSFRANAYESSYGTKISFDKDGNTKKKYLFMDYLLSCSICYIEIPKFITKDNVAQQSYDKFLVTKNSAIMGAWMGMSPEEMTVKYGNKVQSTVYELTSGELRFVKCVTSGKGNSIVAPRNSFTADNVSTCVPLFMLYAFMKGLEEYYTEGILKFTYLKDNNTTRELCTTTSNAIMMDYYKDQQHVSGILDYLDLGSNKQGGMALSPKQHRGYLKLPELGLSKYDATGVRALNLARILTVEQIAEVDRTYIDVDLDSCVANFYDCLDYLVTHMPDKLTIVLKGICGQDINVPEDASVARILDEIHSFVDMRAVLLSTTFFKALHKFMMSAPEIFPYYVGLPKKLAVGGSSESFGVAEMEGF